VAVPSSKKTQTDFVKRNFRQIWPVHLTAFSRLLTLLRREFDGDLDLLVVLAVIAERTPPGNWVSEVDNLKDTLLGADAARSQDPINMSSIADYSGIPRETVRRKIIALERKGWVARDRQGSISVQPRAARDLERATGHSIDYLSEILAAYDAATARTG
jgi:DNA-binding MarR family transcriptional regulator